MPLRPEIVRHLRLGVVPLTIISAGTWGDVRAEITTLAKKVRRS